ncbi:homoserine dehydrogenase [Rehaibacterium terrae]|uniref:homoserine dehydrogenase n=1 Tax=Rehaibacterium terrae TaxID=1341696 RepID=A0A7W7V8E1_9GAMM|nr:homoserine dehydrogenase [Rehaibacterium terrae]
MAAATEVAPATLALIGTGQVAQALIAQIARLRSCGVPVPLRLVQLANARGVCTRDTPDWHARLAALAALPRGARNDPTPRIADAVELVIDLSASDAVAACHAEWLRQGRIVVTANKCGLGESAARAETLQAHIDAAPWRYGDSATVGAGLGAVRRLRELRACGETVHEIAGVLSGTLAWLFDRYDGRAAFSACVREAHALGLTEPDPRDDVGGADVLRKLRILARAIGWRVPDDGVRIDPRLRCGQGDDPWADIAALDTGIAALFAERPTADARLAVVARARPGDYRIGIEWLPPDDPLAQRGGCDNAILIRSERYAERPLVLRGPGAGPALTAAAVLEDALTAWRAQSRQG